MPLQTRHATSTAVGERLNVLYSTKMGNRRLDTVKNIEHCRVREFDSSEISQLLLDYLL